MKIELKSIEIEKLIHVLFLFVGRRWKGFHHGRERWVSNRAGWCCRRLWHVNNSKKTKRRKIKVYLCNQYQLNLSFVSPTGFTIEYYLDQNMKMTSKCTENCVSAELSPIILLNFVFDYLPANAVYFGETDLSIVQANCLHYSW